MSNCSIFFFVDALGAAITENLPRVRGLAEHWRPLRSIFGYSSTCVPSILSGRYPEEHNHWSYFIHQDGKNLQIPPWVKMLPSFVRDRGRIRRYLSSAVGRHNGIKGYFQMYMMPIDQLHKYGHCEPKNIFRENGMNIGTNIVDDLHQFDTDFWMSDWHRPTEENWARMEVAAADPNKTFLFNYDAHIDGWLHENTKESSLLGGVVDELVDRIETVLAKAQACHDEVSFYLFSDHGMCTITEHLDLFPIFDGLPIKMHEDYHCVIDSTMVRLWFTNPKSKTILLDALAGVSKIKLLDDDYLARERCNFNDNRFGDVIYLADPGVLLVPSHLGKVPLAGMHGYSCDHADSDATFLTNDPEAKPETIADIYHLMHAAAKAGARRPEAVSN